MRLSIRTWQAACLAACGLVPALACGGEAGAGAAADTAERVNAASLRWGLASARASSVYGAGYEAERALDGRWQRRETDKWNTASGAPPPQWLAVDLGREFAADRIVLRHEGVFAEGERYNTSDFRLQKGESAAGPWTDLLPPVRGNRAAVTVHDFAPTPLRYLRLLAETGEQGGRNEYARIFELEVPVLRSRLATPLVALAWAAPARLRRGAGGQSERLAAVEVVLPSAAAPVTVEVAVDGQAVPDLAAWDGQGRRELWVPVRAEPPVEVTVRVRGATGADASASRRLLPGGAEYFADGGTLHIVSSSHQDIAWMDSPEACAVYRADHCITPALDLMGKDPDYRFVMENMLNLMEYLERHPERRDQVVQYTREGRLEWGATFNQPYESLFSGEQLVRETYFGRRWLRANLPGCDARVAFNPDVPGRALQMQQILAKAGIPYLVISRYHEGIYRWQSPDGTGVIAWTPGHYCNTGELLNAKATEAAPRLVARLEELGAYYGRRGLPPAVCLLNSQDFSRPTDFGPLIRLWNGAEPGGAAGQGLALGTMQYSSAAAWFDRLQPGRDRLDVVTGERPNVWLYIHGPTHHWAISAMREAAVWLPAAEAFSTFRCLLGGAFRAYPAARLSEAWKAAIYPDHGWGGKNGHITDNLFLEKARFARDEARLVLGEALAEIAGQVTTDRALGRPVVVFNALSWSRPGPVEVRLGAVPAGPVRVLDAAGREVPCQWSRLGEPDEINVAAASEGTTAVATSAHGPAFGAGKAIDGKWARRDEDKWVSDPGPGPHVLTLDFGQSRTIHRIVVRHEGGLGAFQEEEAFNTADFQIQGAAAPAGPWTDLVPPVIGNRAVLSAFRFAPQAVRCLRLTVTRANSGRDTQARVYEVQAFAANPDRQAALVFVAGDVPALGYGTWYVTAGKPAPGTDGVRVDADGGENRFLRLRLAPGGIASLVDRETERELLRTDKFLGGELFTLQSVGNGAGEFPAVQQPTMEGFDKLSLHRPDWRLVEEECGPVRAVWELTQPLATCTVRQRLVLYHTTKRLDLETELADWDGTKWREFRLAFPVNAATAEVAYEVPMGMVEVGRSEVPTTGGLAYGHLTYFEPCRDIRPREVQNLISANTDGGGLTLATPVAVNDYRDPTPEPVAYPVLQPVLLASRKSCHGEGNWYLQPGDHTYRVSLFAHAPGWRQGYRQALGANQPLVPVAVTAPPAQPPTLPPAQSFCEVSAPNVLVSTIKKAEDDERVVVRVCEMEGRDATATRLRLAVPLAAAEHTNLIEDGDRPLPVTAGGTVTVDVGHHAIETVKLRPGR